MAWGNWWIFPCPMGCGREAQIDGPYPDPETIATWVCDECSLTTDFVWTIEQFDAWYGDWRSRYSSDIPVRGEK